MRLYAERADLRWRQVGADLGMLVWAAVWIWAALETYDAVHVLDRPSQSVEDLGSSVAGAMDTAAGIADGLPLVGDDLAEPFQGLADAAGSVGGAGAAVQDAVGTLALVLVTALIVLPIGWLLLRWLPWRTRFVREVAVVERMLAGTLDLELLAARAVATAPLPRLAALPPGTTGAWRSGDPAAVRELATVELDRLGLRVPSS
ncbi:hypothetical protein [Blastococcus goldschmidtiae]|uniref:Transmembrane protein n=1 Tax=Blastococcus goldschmidtiae TaxID=3075546 RepID=A0ABU2KAB1_9ACTN|nr:hypothetical protein [Blastococcus sp. DSM 46792]MDT0277134.1 hypothetical protein [Blastococcus sp. DSM 46792]